VSAETVPLIFILPPSALFKVLSLHSELSKEEGFDDLKSKPDVGSIFILRFSKG